MRSTTTWRPWRIREPSGRCAFSRCPSALPFFPSLPCSLTYTANAFAARLTARQVRLLQALPDVAHIQRDEAVTTQDPHAPTFINVKGAVWKAAGGQSSAGKGIIIGVIDTGIWPEHPSFSDVSDGLNGTDQIFFPPWS